MVPHRSKDCFFHIYLLYSEIVNIQLLIISLKYCMEQCGLFFTFVCAHYSFISFFFAYISIAMR